MNAHITCTNRSGWTILKPLDKYYTYCPLMLLGGSTHFACRVIQEGGTKAVNRHHNKGGGKFCGGDSFRRNTNHGLIQTHALSLGDLAYVFMVAAI